MLNSNKNEFLMFGKVSRASTVVQLFLQTPLPIATIAIGLVVHTGTYETPQGFNAEQPITGASDKIPLILIL